jgi:hypothetical protein
MRLIDKDALEVELDAWARIIQNPDHYMRADALYIIDTAPEIDAVPVVRCKDCKHYDTIGCSKGIGWCKKMDIGTSDNFYCANGKQLNKESEDD